MNRFLNNICNKKIINKDVKYEDTLGLKQNVIHTISALEESLDMIYDQAPSQYDQDAVEIFYILFSSDFEDLEGRIEEMNNILYTPKYTSLIFRST
jgi:hypothetical protein